VNFFGPQKENMTPDDKDAPQEKPAGGQAQGRARKEVDLFPALIDRKTAPIVAPRAHAVGAQISMFTPNTFDEALDIVECLRTRASTTICLEKMKKLDAVRLVDFVAGASAAIDGDFHKLSEQVYLFCPSNVKIIAPGKNDSGRLISGDRGALDYLFAKDSLSGKSGFDSLWSR
jgi:cell division inhibitor SepF